MPRDVVLLVGPPCAGKTTWVERNAGAARVVDFDLIARNLGSPDRWDHPEDVRQIAAAIRADEEAAVAADPDAQAVVVRSAGRAADRESIARRIGATNVVVLDPGRDEALRRAAQQQRPNWTASVIDRWYGLPTPPPPGGPRPIVAEPSRSGSRSVPENDSNPTPDDNEGAAPDQSPNHDNDQQGNESGFPANTPVAEMTHAQQAAYWRAESKKQQGIAKSRQDYDALKAKADQLDKVKQENLSDQEKAIADARAEARAEVAREANEKAAMTILRANLQARGVSGDDLDELLDTISPSRLISDDDVDTDKVTRIATRLAGPMRPGAVDMGQGRRKQTTASKAEAGRAEAEKRFGPKAGSR